MKHPKDNTSPRAIRVGIEGIAVTFVGFLGCMILGTIAHEIGLLLLGTALLWLGLLMWQELKILMSLWGQGIGLGKYLFRKGGEDE